MFPTMNIFPNITLGFFILAMGPLQFFIVFLGWSVAFLWKRIIPDYKTAYFYLVEWCVAILTAVCLWNSWSEATVFVKGCIVTMIGLVTMMSKQENACDKNLPGDVNDDIGDDGNDNYDICDGGNTNDVINNGGDDNDDLGEGGNNNDIRDVDKDNGYIGDGENDHSGDVSADKDDRDDESDNGVGSGNVGGSLGGSASCNSPGDISDETVITGTTDEGNDPDGNDENEQMETCDERDEANLRESNISERCFFSGCFDGGNGSSGSLGGNTSSEVTSTNAEIVDSETNVDSIEEKIHDPDESITDGKHENQDNVREVKTGACHSACVGNCGDGGSSKDESVGIESKDRITDVENKTHDDAFIREGSNEDGDDDNDDVRADDHKDGPVAIDSLADSQEQYIHVDDDDDDDDEMGEENDEHDDAETLEVKTENVDVVYTREVNDVEQSHEDTYIKTMNTAQTVYGGMGNEYNMTDSSVQGDIPEFEKINPTLSSHQDTSHTNEPLPILSEASDSSINKACTVYGNVGCTSTISDSKIKTSDTNINAPLLENNEGNPNINMQNVSIGSTLRDIISSQDKQSEEEVIDIDTQVECQSGNFQDAEDPELARNTDKNVKNDEGDNDKDNDNDDDNDDDIDDDDDDDIDDDDDDDDNDDDNDDDEEEEEENNDDFKARKRLKRVAKDLKDTKDHVKEIKSSLEEMKSNSNDKHEGCDMKKLPDLWKAAREGNQREFRSLLKDPNLDIRKRDEQDNNLLHLACIGGNADIVKELLVEYKFDIDSEGENKRNPIMLAALHGHSKVFKLLQDYGCSPMMQDVDGNTEIHLACAGGNMEIVGYLLEQKKVHVNARNLYGRTPLMFASQNGKTEVVKYLAKVKGCDLHAVDKDGDDSIKFAQLGGHDDVVEFLTG